jgi:hypothetical protein
MKAINTNGKVVTLQSHETANGTWLQGYIETTYARLVSVFGTETHINPDSKVDAEWMIMTPAGVATIYNYKNGENYRGEYGINKTDISEWNIGGKNEEVVNWIERALQTN